MSTETVNDNSSYSRDYRFSFTQSYTYRNQLISNNLQQAYFVDQYTIYDF